jgi:Bacterial PH domain
MKFTASFDGLAKVVTISSIIIMIIIFTIAFPYFIQNPSEMGIEAIFIPLFLIIIFLGIFIFRPISYSITDQEIIVHRPFKDIKISRKDIQSIEILDKKFSENTLRTFGVGGAWGYFGKFTHSSFGSMDWYVTRRDKLVLLKVSGNKKLVVSPDELELFVQELKSLEIK